MTTLRAPDFDFICEVVRREAAIVLEPGKEYLAENRLHPVARRLGYDDIAGLVDSLRLGDRSLTDEVVDALTTNETSFYRDGHPWDALRDHVLPDLFEKRRFTRKLNVWFAAASSGQEPYSFAMMLKEHFAEQLETHDVRLVATDISRSMLDRCRAGRYSQIEVNRGLPAKLMVEYFERDGMSFVIREDVRAMIEFEELNLSAPLLWGWLPTFDLVFIRNVLIYFDVDMKRYILENVRRNLADDGTLLLGASETTINITDEFKPVQVGPSTCYRPV